MKPAPRHGKVFLVGAGPGDADLLTVKAVRILRSAEVVLHDDLVGPGVLDLIPKTAQVHNVGKRCGRPSMRQDEINALLVAVGALGLRVVRLKGGDPLVFGRAGGRTGSPARGEDPRGDRSRSEFGASRCRCGPNPRHASRPLLSAGISCGASCEGPACGRIH